MFYVSYHLLAAALAMADSARVMASTLTKQACLLTRHECKHTHGLRQGWPTFGPSSSE
jgi:hypothetical protein